MMTGSRRLHQQANQSHCSIAFPHAYNNNQITVLRSDGVKAMTHEAKAKAKAMNHKAKAKAKDLTLRRHLYCNVNINKQQAYN